MGLRKAKELDLVPEYSYQEKVCITFSDKSVIHLTPREAKHLNFYYTPTGKRLKVESKKTVWRERKKDNPWSDWRELKQSPEYV